MSLRSRVLSVACLAGVVAVSSALAGSDTTAFTVTSPARGKTVLPLRAQSSAHVQIDPSRREVAGVDYFLDGFHAPTAHGAQTQRRHVETPPPNTRRRR